MEFKAYLGSAVKPVAVVSVLPDGAWSRRYHHLVSVRTDVSPLQWRGPGSLQLIHTLGLHGAPEA